MEYCAALSAALEKRVVMMTKPLTILKPDGPGGGNRVALAMSLCPRPWHGKELKSQSGKRKWRFFPLCRDDQRCAWKLAKAGGSKRGDNGSLSLPVLDSSWQLCPCSPTGQVRFGPGYYQRCLPPHLKPPRGFSLKSHSAEIPEENTMMSFQSDRDFPAVGIRHVVGFVSLCAKIRGKEGDVLLPRSLFK